MIDVRMTLAEQLADLIRQIVRDELASAQGEVPAQDPTDTDVVELARERAARIRRARGVR